MEVNVSLSALKPSAYREFVKGWDKTRYNALFRMFTDNPKAYRIYLDPTDVDSSVSEDDIDVHVLKAIKSKGIAIDDYVAWYGLDSHGRRVKLGRYIENDFVRQRFANDPIRQASKKGEFACVISRHPYDLAGMSADRGWVSCTSIPTSHPGTIVKTGRRAQNYPGTNKKVPKESIVNHGGSNARYLRPMVDAGTLVAYWIRRSDENINNPSARILLKVYKDSTGAILLRPSNMYGTAPKQFSATLTEWCDKVNKEFFHTKTLVTYDLAEGQYSDGEDPDDIDTVPSEFDETHIDQIARTLSEGTFDETRRMVRVLLGFSAGVPETSVPALATALNLALRQSKIKNPLAVLTHVLSNMRVLQIEPDSSPAVEAAFNSLIHSCGLLCEEILASPTKHKANTNSILEGSLVILNRNIGTLDDLLRISLVCIARVQDPGSNLRYSLISWMKYVDGVKDKVSAVGVRTNYALAFLAFVVVLTKARTLKSITWPAFSKQMAVILRTWDVDLKTVLLSIPVLCSGKALPAVKVARVLYAGLIQQRPIEERQALLAQLPPNPTLPVKGLYTKLYSKVQSNRILGLFNGMWGSHISVSGLKSLLGDDVYDSVEDTTIALSLPRPLVVHDSGIGSGFGVTVDLDLTQPIADQLGETGTPSISLARSLVDALSGSLRDKTMISALSMLSTADDMIKAAVKGSAAFVSKHSGARSNSPLVYAACVNHVSTVFEALRVSLSSAETTESEFDAAMVKADKELDKAIASIPRPTKAKNAVDLAGLVGVVQAAVYARPMGIDAFLKSGSSELKRVALSVICSVGSSYKLARYNHLDSSSRADIREAYLELCSLTGAGRAQDITDDTSYFGDMIQKIVRLAPDLHQSYSDDDDFTPYFTTKCQDMLLGKTADPFEFIQVGSSVIDSVSKTRKWARTPAGSEAVRRVIRTLAKNTFLTGMRAYYLLALVEPDQLVAEYLALGLIAPYTAKLFSSTSTAVQSIENMYEFSSGSEVKTDNKLSKLVNAFTYFALRCRRVSKLNDFTVLPLDAMPTLSLRAHVENSDLAYGGPGPAHALASFWRGPQMLGLSMSDVSQLSRQEMMDWIRFCCDDRFPVPYAASYDAKFSPITDETLRQTVADIRGVLEEDRTRVDVDPITFETFCVPLIAKDVKPSSRLTAAQALTGFKIEGRDDQLSISAISSACVLYAGRWSQSPTFESDVRSLSKEQLLIFLTNAGFSDVFVKSADYVVPDRPLEIDDHYDLERPRRGRMPTETFDLNEVEEYELQSRFIKSAPVLHALYLASDILTGQSPQPLPI